MPRVPVPGEWTVVHYVFNGAEAEAARTAVTAVAIKEVRATIGPLSIFFKSLQTDVSSISAGLLCPPRLPIPDLQGCLRRRNVIVAAIVGCAWLRVHLLARDADQVSADKPPRLRPISGRLPAPHFLNVDYSPTDDILPLSSSISASQSSRHIAYYPVVYALQRRVYITQHLSRPRVEQQTSSLSGHGVRTFDLGKIRHLLL